MLIIGSFAASNHLSNWRSPKDIDIFHAENIDKLSSHDIKVDSFWHPKFAGTQLDRDGIATLDELYTIKLSHAYWELSNGSWNKHMIDLINLKKAGAKAIPALHSLLYSIWEEKHGTKRMQFLEKDSFFKDAVVRVYDHDSIHESVAYGDHALYIDFLKPECSVDIDMRKVWAAPFETQVMLFKEEVFATALERILIPKNYEYSPRAAYAWALRRTITSLTKGKSAMFMADNYDKFISPEADYVKRHLENNHKLIRLER